MKLTITVVIPENNTSCWTAWSMLIDAGDASDMEMTAG